VTLVQSIILAIIEGLTEFLPVSSTGHMIIASSVMGIASDPFTKLFTVSIQLGAIVSVIVLYWRRFFQSFDFYFKIGFAFIPAVVAGLLFKSYVDALLERVDIVGYSLLLGGIFFLFLDKIFDSTKKSEPPLTYPRAFKIGMFQILAMIPGVSRSAATIIGGLSQNLTKKSAAEFSFFLAVPTMFGATLYSGYDYYKGGFQLTSSQVNLLLTGNIVAFIVAMIAIKSFIAFLTTHGFKVFGYYRIIVGIGILVLYYLGAELSII
jgi:undecaprenyl-diphosphatase